MLVKFAEYVTVNLTQIEKHAFIRNSVIHSRQFLVYIIANFVGIQRGENAFQDFLDAHRHSNT